MATIGFRYIKGPYVVNHLPEAASQSFKAGDLVILTSGKVAIVTSDQTVYGVALKDASGTTGADVPVLVIQPDQIFLAQADTTTAATHVGGKYGLNIGTAGSMSVDIGDTSTTTVRIEKLDPRDGAKANGRVYVKFDPDKLQNL